MFGFNKPRFREMFKSDIAPRVEYANTQNIAMSVSEWSYDCVMYSCDMCLEFQKQSDGLLTSDWIEHITKETCAVYRELVPGFGTAEEQDCIQKAKDLMRNQASTRITVDRYYNRI